MAVRCRGSLLRGVSILLLLALLRPASLASQVEEGDIQQYLPVLEPASASTHHEPMAVLWGLADAVATVGKLFQYTLPEEAFNGDVTQYKVQEWGGSGLPSWLTFDPSRRLLRGIPGEEDIGQEHLLQVTAVNQVSPELASQAKEVFTVAVVEDDTPHSLARPLKEATQQGLKPIHCAPGSSVTMVTIVVDAELSVMPCESKISMMDGICHHLGLPPELLKLLPVGNRPMLDSSALVAGPGDVKQPQHSGATVQWVVGCGNVNAAHMPVLQQLESTSQDGSMSSAVKHGIIGWHVTNNRPNAPIRLKRRAQRNFTPTPNQGSSGPPTQQPVPTYRVDESDLPATRMVPTMVSPSWDIQPTKSRHHHRHKTKGRHKHHRSSRRHGHHQSPTHHTSNHKTKFTRTPMPTPTVLPIRPTRSMDISPTMVDSSLQRVTPSVPTSSPGVSRTASVVEPSMTPITPPITESTQLLPISTHIIHPPLTTEPIHTTKDTSTSATHEPPVVPTTEPPSTSTPPTAATTTSPTEAPPGPVTPSPFDYAPILRNDIDRLEVDVGDILNYTIPKQTFFDFEDGNTENLKLVFMTVDGLTLPRNSWVKFDQKKQVLYGLPLPEHEGRQEYIMAAIDRKGKIARDAFEILVQRRSHNRKINHEFSLNLDLDYRQFLMDVERRIDVARKLASLYGDTNADKITVTRIEQGSVIYTWTNNSLPYAPCPTSQLGDLYRRLMLDNNSVNPELAEQMRPFNVKKVSYSLKGSCVSIPITSPPPTDKDVLVSPKESQEEMLITTVVPAIVIAVMLILAACIAFVLYRKNRRGKLSDEDQQTFVNKGIPIIFQDELEDKPDPPSKPLILTNEKPPLPPPEYPRSAAGSLPSTPGSAHKDHYDTEEDHDDMTSPLYQPPPPFTAARDMRHGRPRAQPTYRNPPPYVPP